MNKRLIPFIALLFLCAGSVSILLYTRHQQQRPFEPIQFYGLVVDESGVPVVGAEVGISIVKIVGVSVDYPGSGTTVRTTTDSHGRFSLLGEKGVGLNIIYLRKPGYVWVYDLRWDVVNPLPDSNDNRSYLYQKVPQYAHSPVYLPDPQRPAIFPLQHMGSQVTGAPSRGGSDKFPDGRTVRNERIQPAIPTTGPSAPMGLDREHLLHDLYLKSHPQQK